MIVSTHTFLSILVNKNNLFALQGKENPSSIVPPQAHDICTIMYTSGTSGDPKGVEISHENIVALVRAFDLFLEQFEDKVNLMHA